MFIIITISRMVSPKKLSVVKKLAFSYFPLCNARALTCSEISLKPGADPGFDQGGAPDRDRPNL